jgi:hypothetical protein
MPTVLRTGPYRLYFYSDDRREPPHVHVARDASRAKYWLKPVRLQTSEGFGAVELNKIESIVQDNHRFILGKWNAFFGH